MSATATQCYICKDDMSSTYFVSEFDGTKHPVCVECADGITDGLRILESLNVTGETDDK